jgi:nucleoid DNA-binding protein
MATAKAAAKKKAPAKKTAAKKAPAKKAPAKKAPAAKAPARKVTALQEKLTKTQIVATISENTGLNKKQVGEVMDELETLIERSIKKRSVGEFTLPGLMKITTVKKPARKARKGRNPFTGEETVFKAKPASVAVKVRPLKKMKEFAGS